MNRWIARVFGVLLAAAMCTAAVGGPLKGPLTAFEPFIGTWEVEGKWASGVPLWARTRYEPVLDGNFLAARTVVIEQNGTLYERYRSMIAHDPARGVFPIHSFTFTGDHRVLDYRADGEGRFVIEWTMGDSELKELAAFHGADRMEWKVWSRKTGETEWELQLDAEWKKIDDAAPVFAPRLPLADALSPLRPMLGAWEVNTKWPDGVALWSLHRVEASPGGNFLASTTLARDGDAEPYERYRGFLFKDRDGAGFSEIVFTHTGSVITAPGTMTTGPAPVYRSIVPPGSDIPLEVEKRMEFTSDDAFHWTVRGRRPDTEAWTPLGEGTWRRVSRAEGAPTMPIDTSLFVSSGAEVRSFVREIAIDAPPAEVFRAWATREGWEAAYAKGSPSTVGNIELAIGGRYEWLFNGVLGSNGCQVLSYVPDRMISFTWNSPPTQPVTRQKRTWVVVDLTPDGEGTKVRLTHLGFGEGPEWDETFNYFGNAWNFVLNRMKTVLEAEGQ